MDALLSFGAALVSLRLGRACSRAGGARLGRRARVAYAAARPRWPGARRTAGTRYAFRVYYLAGALLSAPLLGVGSLQLTGRRWAAPVGAALHRPRRRARAGDARPRDVRGDDVPRAQDHLDVAAARGRDRGQLARDRRRGRRRRADAPAPAARQRPAARSGRVPRLRRRRSTQTAVGSGRRVLCARGGAAVRGCHLGSGRAVARGV